MIIVPSMHGILGGRASGGAGVARNWPFRALMPASANQPVPLGGPRNGLAAGAATPNGAKLIFSAFNSPAEMLGTPIDIVSGTRGTFSGTNSVTAEQQVSGLVGVRKFASGSSNYAAWTAFDLSAYNSIRNGNIAFSWWMWWDAFANDNKIAWEYSTNVSSTTNVAVNCAPNNSGSGAFTINLASASASNLVQAQFTRSANGIAAGKWVHYVWTFPVSGNNISGAGNLLYVNGVLVSRSGTSQSGILASVWQANAGLYFMSRGAASNFADGRLAYFNIFSGCLQEADAKYMYANPTWHLRNRVDWT